MPIIRNLKKDFDEGRMDSLRSISFEDTGTKAPYVTKPIGSTSNQVTKRIDDLARMGQMLIDKPGLEHLAKEALLKQGEITDKLRRNSKYNTGTDVGNFLRRATGTIEHLVLVAGSTLAQIPVNGTGTHFVRGFKRDTYLQESTGFKTPVAGSTYSLEGESVPMSEVNSNSILPNNTTASPGDLGKLNIGIQGELKPSYGEAGKVVDNYNSVNTFTNTVTDLNIEKASDGIAITNQTELTENTTVSEGTLGTSNTDVLGTLEAPFKRSNSYSNTRPFTGNDTLTNANNVQNGVSISKPEDLTRNTTPTSGSLGQTNKNVTGDIPEQVTLSNYRPNGTYTETDTVTNVNNVRNGNPTNNPSGTGEFDQTFAVQTTAVKEQLGVTNKAIGGDKFEQKITTQYNSDNTYTSGSTLDNRISSTEGTPIVNPRIGTQTTAVKEQFGVSNTNVKGDTTPSLSPDINKFKLDKKKSKLDTQGNILLTQPLTTGSIVNIPLSETPVPDEYVVNQMSKQLFSPEDTYTKKTAKEHIDILKHGDGKNPKIAKRLNSSKDTIAGTSTPIPSQDEQKKAAYNQTVASTKVEDFRGKDVFGGGIKNTYSFDYSAIKINKETRVGLGNPGKRSRLRTSYTASDPDTVDQINKLDVSEKPLDGIDENRDLIQLEFQVITPEKTYYLAFRAFLETFDDSFNASWNSSKYLGRADSFYTYNGFERSINIGFKIAAQSKEEMKPLYKKAATLASVTAPSYGTGGRFMRGSIAKVTVGDYIYEQPGIIESVQYTWQKDYPWEISFQNPEGEGGKDQILPHVLDVSISFKVIHDFLPEAGVTPFITNHRPIKGNKDTYIPLEDRKFIVPETAAEKREKLVKEEAAKKEAAAQAKAASEDKILVDNNLVGPLENPNSSRETTTSPFDFGGFGI